MQIKMAILQGLTLWTPFQITQLEITSLPLITFTLASGAFVNYDTLPFIRLLVGISVFISIFLIYYFN